MKHNNPIKLRWNNNSKITFEKIITLDNKFLFNIEQKIINNSEKTYNFYPYGQIIRNTAPLVSKFFILFEGILGVFDGELVEEPNALSVEDDRFCCKKASTSDLVMRPSRPLPPILSGFRILGSR